MASNRGKAQQRNKSKNASTGAASIGASDLFPNRGYQRGPIVKDRIESLGRTLTKILRHMAVELNLNMRSDGFCSVDEILKLNMKTLAGLPLCTHSVEDVLKAVELDSKQRFSTIVEGDQIYIRANQGHSIQQVRTEELLTEIKTAEEVPVCVHGTFKSNLKSIMQQGLKRMSRNHVHFATGLPSENGVISGMKSMCDMFIYLDVAKALHDGMKLYISDNKVILSEGFNGVIPVKYFEKVVDRKSNKVVWPAQN